MEAAEDMATLIHDRCVATEALAFGGGGGVDCGSALGDPCASLHCPRASTLTHTHPSFSLSPSLFPVQGGWGNADPADGLAEFAEKLGSTVGEDGRRIVAAMADRASRLKDGVSAFLDAVRR